MKARCTPTSSARKVRSSAPSLRTASGKASLNCGFLNRERYGAVVQASYVHCTAVVHRNEVPGPIQDAFTTFLVQTCDDAVNRTTPSFCWFASSFGAFVDVMAAIVVATSVTRQYPHNASKARQIKIKERNCADISSRALEANKHGCTRKINMRTPCVKNLCRHTKGTTGAEDTQNQHYQRVLTVVDSFPKLLLVLRFTRMAGVHTPSSCVSSSHPRHGHPSASDDQFWSSIPSQLASPGLLASWTNCFATRDSICFSPG